MSVKMASGTAPHTGAPPPSAAACSPGPCSFPEASKRASMSAWNSWCSMTTCSQRATVACSSHKAPLLHGRNPVCAPGFHSLLYSTTALYAAQRPHLDIADGGGSQAEQQRLEAGQLRSLRANPHPIVHDFTQ